MNEFEELKQEWKKESFNDLQIEETLQILKKIYIGQNIRTEGVLKSQFSDKTDKISNLLKKGLLEENKWHSHELYFTTEEGSRIAKSYLENEIKAKEHLISGIVDGIPFNLLKFLLFDYFAKSLIYPVGREYFFDWRDHIFKDIRVQEPKERILKRLQDLGFCIITPMYVSTRGGELRNEYYVLSKEVQNQLLNVRPSLTSGLYETHKKNCIIFYFLKEVLPYVKPYVSNSKDPTAYKIMVDTLRQNYWDKLQNLNLTEEDIKIIIDKLSQAKITTQYKGILNDDLPFIIEDEIKYHIFLEKMLIMPVMLYLFEEDSQKEVGEKIKQASLVSKEERLEFYDFLGEFETKLRDFIVSKLGKDLGNSKYDTKKLEKLKNRKEADNQFGIPLGDIVDYANFEEYADIIKADWDKFSLYFNDESEIVLPLKWINALSRRPLAHFRKINRTMINHSKQLIGPILEKINRIAT